jgi:hypothetical protein
MSENVMWSQADMIEVTLSVRDDFLKVKETLTRIGVSSRKERKLFQSCHILHKRDRDTQESRYYIVHFKELFALDKKPSNFSENDLARRNTIANLVAEWGLVALVDPDKSSEPVAPLSQIKILSFSEKDTWELCPKYNIGRKPDTN